MERSPIIALDAMGGDVGPDVVVPAAFDVLARQRDIRMVLVGDEAAVRERMAKQPEALRDRVTVRHASQRVAMDELPSSALRQKKDSSMRVAIDLVKRGEADACVSAGNTGALMAIARFVLKTLPNIERPAIVAAMPSRRRATQVLDLGANVDCTAEHLFQFAVMGSVLASAVDNLDAPRIGLMNVGEEEIKGNEQVKEAALRLQASDLNYIGFVEGNDIFNDKADVIVCDGFVGNVALKASEGTAKLIGQYVKQAFSGGLLSRLAGLAAYPVLRALRHTIDPRRYNGASLLGLQGIVVKSHGGADRVAFANAIDIAILEVQKGVPARISRRLETHLAERQSG